MRPRCSGKRPATRRATGPIGETESQRRVRIEYSRAQSDEDLTTDSQCMICKAPHILAVAASVFHCRLTGAQSVSNFQPPKTQIAHQIYDLHFFVQAICVGICVVMFAMLFYAIARFRKSPRRTASQFTGYKPVEITWVIVPVLILVVVAVPATH